MASRFEQVPNRRAIIDRRALAERLGAAARGEAVALLKGALAGGRAEIARRLEDKPYSGTETAAAYAFLTDQIIRLVHDHVTLRMI